MQPKTTIPARIPTLRLKSNFNKTNAARTRKIKSMRIRTADKIIKEKASYEIKDETADQSQGVEYPEYAS